MRLSECTTVALPLARVWELVCDPAGYERLFPAAEWRPCGSGPPGRGRQYFTRFPVGSALIGGRVEIVEYAPPGDIAWHSVTGVDQRGRIRLRARGEERTEVTIRLAYQVPGGALGLLTGYVAAPLVRRLLRQALAALARQPGPLRAA